jgi:hypothetical protein
VCQATQSRILLLVLSTSGKRILFVDLFFDKNAGKVKLDICSNFKIVLKCHHDPCCIACSDALKNTM